MTRFVVGMFLAGMMVVGAGAVSGQPYPNKPVRIVIGGAGGGNDFLSRLIAQGISIPLGQQVIVDNRAGIVPMEVVARASADGYTLLLNSNAMWISSLLGKTSYDPVKDFSPITVATSSPNILAVHSSVPAHSVNELIALAKAKPGILNYASSYIGTATHLSGELFKGMAGVNIVGINYRSGGQAVNALVGGEVQVGFISATTIAPHIKSGKLRALGVTSVQPSVLAPGVPTVAASVPGYEMRTIVTLFAPAGTPSTVINRLNQEIVRLLNQPDVVEKVLGGGAEPVGSSPEQLALAMKSEMARLGKVIKDAGIRAE